MRGLHLCARVGVCVFFLCVAICSVSNKQQACSIYAVCVLCVFLCVRTRLFVLSHRQHKLSPRKMPLDGYTHTHRGPNILLKSSSVYVCLCIPLAGSFCRRGLKGTYRLCTCDCTCTTPTVPGVLADLRVQFWLQEMAVNTVRH